MKVTKDQFTYPISGNRTIAFPFLNHGFYSWLKKEKKGEKKACVMNPNQLWQWAPQGSIIAGKQQLLRSCTC